ncbi:aspartate/glutamate racemase family protein [Phycicoccus sonneratiae]|uniref:Asp/Glu racemase n=1 Tax=Phycicoccus sonneratiae TaxID=2807628 RepID=A0ABS2CQJ2_9MICO|nr:aspartate/glutamate racemase family protein [Phycicoccus sonneraticus]MBM6402149.1 hypothetical protein [Phycicoccus sonneraticus]
MNPSQTARPPTVAVINATAASVAPARAALAEGFPEATVWSLMDDRLIIDAEAAGGLTPGLSARMASLIDYAVNGGADAVLLSCTMYGPVVQQERLASTLPMLSADEELFDEVSRRGYGSVLLLGPLPPAVQDSVTRLRTVLDDSPASAATTVVGEVAPGAHALVVSGDLPGLERLLIETATPHLEEVDAVVLGNFSLAPARSGVERALGKPVLSAPLLAATALRARVVGAGTERE